MITAILSIVIITIVIWLAQKIFPFEICPICAGVSLTWLWLLVGMRLNLLLIVDYQLITAILMGGTAVGLMSKLEKVIKPKFLLFWKTFFVVLCFIAVYSLISADWILFSVSTVLAVTSTFVFKTKNTSLEQQELNDGESTHIKQIDEQMKNCC